jgi:hypothetical protein
MTIATMTLLEGATITPSGGSALTFSASSSSNGNSIKAYCNEDVNLVTRRNVEFSASEPRPNANSPSGFTLARNSIYVKVPFELANGEITTHTLQIKMARDAEALPANILEMRKLGAQLFIDSELDDFFNQLAVV